VLRAMPQAVWPLVPVTAPIANSSKRCFAGKRTTFLATWPVKAGRAYASADASLFALSSHQETLGLWWLLEAMEAVCPVVGAKPRRASRTSLPMGSTVCLLTRQTQQPGVGTARCLASPQRPRGIAAGRR